MAKMQTNKLSDQRVPGVVVPRLKPNKYTGAMSVYCLFETP